MENQPTSEFADSVPRPFVGLLKASDSLQQLIDGHGLHLIRGAAPQKFANDSETVFLRAAVVFLCSAWEAYVEDLAEMALEEFLRTATDPSDVPEEIRKEIAARIKIEKHHLSPWELAGDGWRVRVKARFLEEKTGLNTPYSNNIEKLFRAACFEEITSCWKWDLWTPPAVKKLLDENLVKSRCEFAHGMPAPSNLTTPWFCYLKAVVEECACAMNNHIVETLEKRTGKVAWAFVRTGTNWALFKKPGK